MRTQEQQIFEQVKKAQNILITFDKVWSGDAVSSALALALYLKKLNKNVEIAAEQFENGKLYKFLPSFDKIQNKLNNLRKFIISLDITNAKVDKIKYKIEDDVLDFIISPKDGFFTQDDIKTRSGSFKYDLIITLDTPDLEALGTIYDNDTEFFYQVPIINIDHHSNNEEYGQINHVELTSIATSEILFNLFNAYNEKNINEDIATCLLAGIISKTKSFKTQNITPQALSISSQLISMGARREEIVNKLYRSRSMNVLKIWGRVLARLSGELDDSLVWSTLTKIDFEKTNTSENDLNEVIDELIINIPQAKIVAMFFETEKIDKKTGNREKRSNAIIYSIKNINSLNLVKKWEPVGTKGLAKISSKKNVQELEKEVINYIKENLKKLPTN